MVYQTHKVVESAIGHYSIARETGGGVLGSLYQAGAMTQHEVVPIAKGMLEAYDKKSYSSGDFNSDLDGLEAGGRVAGSIGTTAGLAALTLRIANIDVNLTGPNKVLNPYKPQTQVQKEKVPQKTNGGSQESDFISEHAANKHKYDPSKPSTPNKTQYGKDVDVAKVREQTINSPDKALSDINSKITTYEKTFDGNLSTAETPTSRNRVHINNKNPNRSSQYPDTRDN